VGEWPTSKLFVEIFKFVRREDIYKESNRGMEFLVEKLV